MLLMKFWMETRWRLLMSLSPIIFAALMPRYDGPQPSIPLELRMGMFLSVFAFFFVMQAAILAGAGIKTQPPVQVAKGLHNSVYFTLALPISRLRLMRKRTIVGILELLAIIHVGLLLLRFLLPRNFPGVEIGLADFLAYDFTIVAIATACYFLSMLFSTFLEDVWQVWGSLIVIGASRGIASLISIPKSIDPFLAVGRGSPLLTHSVPWGVIAIAFVMAAALSVVAARIVQTRDF